MSTIAVQNNSLSDTVLKAVIIYDDFDSATRATALLERAAVRTDEAMKWDIKPWRFDVLKQPTLAALTVAVAANADLIVLAWKRMRSRPTPLLNWLNNWAEHRRIEDAAILLLPSEETETPVPWGEIRAIAEGHGLIFLDRINAGNGMNSASLSRRWQRQLVAPGPVRTLTGRLPVPTHWGINE